MEKSSGIELNCNHITLPLSHSHIASAHSSEQIGAQREQTLLFLIIARANQGVLGDMNPQKLNCQIFISR